MAVKPWRPDSSYEEDDDDEPNSINFYIEKDDPGAKMK